MLIVSIYRTHRDNTSFGENHPYAECNRISYADYKEILTTINDKKMKKPNSGDQLTRHLPVVLKCLSEM